MTLARRIALRPQGARAARWAAWMEKERRATLARAGYACEACGKHDRYVQPDRHHLLQQQASEPWRSSSTLCASLCRSCHGRWHDAQDDDAVRSGLLWAAARRLLTAVRGEHASLPLGEPLDVLHALLREAHARGLEPPGFAQH